MALVGLLVLGLVAGAAVWWWGFAAAPPPAASPVPPAPSQLPAPSTAAASAGPAVSTADGRPLPGPVAEGVRRVYAALEGDDMRALQGMYDPDDSAARWPTVRSRLRPPATRTALLAALRNPPTTPPEVAYLYADGSYGLGFSRTGAVAFIGVGQGEATAPGPSVPAELPSPSPSSGTAGDPYGCLAEREAQDRAYEENGENIPNAALICSYNYGPTLPSTREQCWLATYDMNHGNGPMDDRAERDYRAGCSAYN